MCRYERAPKSAGASLRLPPLNRAMSLSTPAVAAAAAADARDEKMGEMERMVASYKERLDNVTNSYQVNHHLFLKWYRSCHNEWQCATVPHFVQKISLMIDA